MLKFRLNVDHTAAYDSDLLIVLQMVGIILQTTFLFNDLTFYFCIKTRFNSFNASCSKLLLLEGSSAILV